MMGAASDLVIAILDKEVAMLTAERDTLREERKVMASRIAELEHEAMKRDESSQPALTVWFGPLPESNGRSNFTAILMRKDASLMDGLTEGIALDQSEYPDRVRYEADRLRYLIGELKEEPCVLDYDSEKHSGYVEPAANNELLTSALAAKNAMQHLLHNLQASGKRIDLGLAKDSAENAIRMVDKALEGKP